jgi:hypothetical protein
MDLFRIGQTLSASPGARLSDIFYRHREFWPQGRERVLRLSPLSVQDYMAYLSFRLLGGRGGGIFIREGRIREEEEAEGIRQADPWTGRWFWVGYGVPMAVIGFLCLWFGLCHVGNIRWRWLDNLDFFIRLFGRVGLILFWLFLYQVDDNFIPGTRVIRFACLVGAFLVVFIGSRSLAMGKSFEAYTSDVRILLFFGLVFTVIAVRYIFGYRLRQRQVTGTGG